MVKYKVEWSIEARLDLIDILQFYIIKTYLLFTVKS
jgi:hypothetical protein